MPLRFGGDIMMDYSVYILDYEEETGKIIPSRQRVMRFLNFVQTKNVPITEWINTFYEYQDLFLDKLSPKSKIVYRSNIIRFIKYTMEHFHGKQESVIQAHDHGENTILKSVLEKEKQEKQSLSKIGEVTSKPIRKDEKRKKKHTTRIVNHWRYI